MPQMNNNKINESLMENDLKWLVDDGVLIDMHKTKLGKNKDYFVLAIAVNDRTPANDLASFIENSVYDFEDVEVSPATDTKGRYLIYVELARNIDAIDAIAGILKDTSKLSGIDEWKFKTMGLDDFIPFDKENFADYVILDPLEYDQKHPEVEEEPEIEQTPAALTPGENTQESVTESIKNRLKFLMSY